MRSRLVAVCLCACVLAACGGSEGEAGPLPTVAPVSTTDPKYFGQPAGPDVIGAPTIEVVLVDPGVEPRRELRLDPPVGAVESMFLAIDQGLVISIQGEAQAIPAVSLELDATATVESVDAEGITYVLRYDDLRVADDADPLVASQVEDMRDQILGLQGRVRIDDRGRMLSNEMDLSALGGEGFEDLGNEVLASSVPLPEEPVGVGARWEVRSSTSVSGLAMRLSSVYEITELTDEQVVATARVTMTIPGGIRTFGGQAVEFDDGTIVGEGSTTWRFDLPIPVATQSTSGDLTMAMTRGGQRGEVTMTMRQRVETRLR